MLNYIRTLLSWSKMAYSCGFSLIGNLENLDFLQKKFYNINYWSEKGFVSLYLLQARHNDIQFGGWTKRPRANAARFAQKYISPKV